MLREELRIIRQELADQGGSLRRRPARGRRRTRSGSVRCADHGGDRGTWAPGHRARRADAGRDLWGRSRSLGRGRCPTARPGHAGSGREHPARRQGSGEGGAARYVSRDHRSRRCVAPAAPRRGRPRRHAPARESTRKARRHRPGTGGTAARRTVAQRRLDLGARQEQASLRPAEPVRSKMSASSEVVEPVAGLRGAEAGYST